jgi:predicted ATPase
MRLLQAGAGRLPDAPRLVGRDAELVDLEEALAAPDTRLLTLTGPPGVGKTRLAKPPPARWLSDSRTGCVRRPRLTPAL